MTLNLPQAAMLVRARPAVARLVERALEHGGAALTAEDGATLLRARGARDLCSIFAAADAARRAAPCGDRVTYVVDRNINFTDACVKRCGFCAFSRTGIDDEAYFLSEAEVVRRAIEASRYGGQSSRRALSRFAALTSTAITRAPSPAAIITAESPTPPHPKTATVSPLRTRPCCTTARKAVVVRQPSAAACTCETASIPVVAATGQWTLTWR